MEVDTSAVRQTAHLEIQKLEESESQSIQGQDLPRTNLLKEDAEQPEQKQYSKWIVFVFCFLSFVMTAMLVNIISFFALFIKKQFQGQEVTATIVAVVSGGAQLGALLSFPTFPMFADKFGRKKASLIGLIVVFCSVTFQGILGYCDKTQSTMFLILMFIARFAQGSMESLVTVMGQSLVCLYFEQEKDKMLGFLFAADGLGAMVGPLIGSFAYAHGGFTFALFLFSAILIVCIVLLVTIVPADEPDIHHDQAEAAAANNALNNSGYLSTSSDGYQALREARSIEQKITWCGIMKNRRAILAYLCKCMGYLSFMYSNSFFSLDVKKQFHLKDQSIGYFYLAFTVTYTISCAAVPLCFSWVPRRLSFVVGFLIGAVGSLLVSHSSDLYIPTELELIVIGMAVLGLAQGPAIVLAVPEALDSFKLEHGHVDGYDMVMDGKINDKFISFHSFTCNLACFVIPVLGGGIYDAFGYERAMVTCAGILIVYAALFGIFNVGFTPFEDKKREELQRKQLEEKIEMQQNMTKEMKEF